MKYFKYIIVLLVMISLNGCLTLPEAKTTTAIVTALGAATMTSGMMSTVNTEQDSTRMSVGVGLIAAGGLTIGAGSIILGILHMAENDKKN